MRAGEKGEHESDDGNGSCEGDGFLICDITRRVQTRTCDNPSLDCESDDLLEENLRQLPASTSFPQEHAVRAMNSTFLSTARLTIIQIHYQHNMSCI